jgi:hypothetical protein
VDAVREHLDDLSPDVIEELTGGLEADLTDALAGETIDPAAQFGAPAAYAAELRTAAGLDPRADGGDRRRSQSLGSVLAAQWTHHLGRLRRQPWWPELVSHVISLRPAWWVLRAAVLVGLLVAILGLSRSLFWWLLLIAAVALSMAIGRRTVSGLSLGKRLIIGAANTVAAVVAIWIALTLLTDPFGALGTRTEYTTEVVPPESGLYNDGNEVANVFPYDKDGKPLTGVQLFDDRGRPLSAARQYTDKDSATVELIPGIDANGQQRFNVFPLRERQLDGGYNPDTGEPLPAPASTPRNAMLPDPTVPPLVALPSAPPPSPAASASATPTPAG